MIAMISYKLSRGGRGIVPVYIKPFGGLVLERVYFKVDTGADVTTIDKTFLYPLGYTQAWLESNARQDKTRTLSPACGIKESAWYVSIRLMNFAGRDLKNWPIYIRMEEHRNYPNLLGLDILSNFNFTFDFDGAAARFEVARNPALALPRLAAQEIMDFAGE